MWIPIFKTGTHTDSKGNTKTWTEQDLEKIADYNPATHEAPVVIGHPKDNSPAWGWIEAVKKEGNILYAKLKDLVPEFVDMAKKKMFKKRSISLYPDGTLRHIGFLGATPPAVKGLADVQFKSDEAGVISYEFEEYRIPLVGRILQRLREVLIEKFGSETADKVVSDYEIDELKSVIDENKQTLTAYSSQRKEDTNMSFWEKLKKRLADAGISFNELFGSESPPVLYTETDIQKKIDDAVAAKASEFSEAQEKKEAEYKAREDALKAQEAERKKKSISDFCEDLKKKGILIPAMEKLGMGLQNFMEQVAAIETTIEFSEGDGSTGSPREKQTPFEFMQSFLLNLPKAIEFREVAGNDKDVKKGNAAEKLQALVKKKIEANKDLAYSQAFSEVQKENLQLAAEYAEELRS